MKIINLYKKLFKHLSKFVYDRNNITFVTGASDYFYISLRDNLLKSLEKYEKNSTIIVWDLGLLKFQIVELERIMQNFSGGVKY